MENINRELSEKELNEVTGGSHLSFEEVEGLQKGQILIVEDDTGKNIARAEYLGEHMDPGIFHMEHCKVRILEVYLVTGKFVAYDKVDAKAGDEVYISRFNLDFPFRA